MTVENSNYMPKSTPKIIKSIEDVSADTLPIIEILDTIEGEGTYIGIPRILIRVAGCAAGCTHCDTKHSWVADKKYPRYTIAELVRVVSGMAGNVREISITGGEPMHYPGQVAFLSRQLQGLGFKTSIETAGLIFNYVVFDNFDLVSADIKTPGSGVVLSQDNINSLHQLAFYSNKVQLKAIVANEGDLEFLEKNFMRLLRSTEISPIILTPCADNTRKAVPPSELARLTGLIKEWTKAYNIRIIAQQHKLLTYS